MAYVKIALCVSLLVAVTCASLVVSPRDDHNIIDCRDGTTTLLLRTTVEEKGKLLQIVKGTLKVPKYGSNDKEISCIEVTDLLNDGTGGYPDILEGGVKFNYVLFQFTSQRSRGYKFLVEVYTA